MSEIAIPQSEKQGKPRRTLTISMPDINFSLKRKEQKRNDPEIANSPLSTNTTDGLIQSSMIETSPSTATGERRGFKPLPQIDLQGALSREEADGGLSPSSVSPNGAERTTTPTSTTTESAPNSGSRRLSSQRKTAFLAVQPGESRLTKSFDDINSRIEIARSRVESDLASVTASSVDDQENSPVNERKQRSVRLKLPDRDDSDDNEDDETERRKRRKKRENSISPRTELPSSDNEKTPPVTKHRSKTLELTQPAIYRRKPEDDRQLEMKEMRRLVEQQSEQLNKLEKEYADHRQAFTLLVDQYVGLQNAHDHQAGCTTACQII